MGRDLLFNRVGAQVFTHRCNCKGSIGAGIAVRFREQHPEMFEEYRKRSKSEPCEFQLRNRLFWPSRALRALFNLAAQTTPRGKASLEAIVAALSKMKEQADTNKVRSIAISPIGTADRRLSWEKVKSIVVKIFHDWQGILYVYEEYTAESHEG